LAARLFQAGDPLRHSPAIAPATLAAGPGALFATARLHFYAGAGSRAQGGRCVHLPAVADDV
jgi:hypothetical protein